MDKPIIAVDIDDVLAQGTESLRRQVNERLGVNLQPEHYGIPGPYWGYYERVWEQNGLSGLINFEELNPIMVHDQSHVPPMKYAKQVLSKLSKRYRLIVVTARDIDWQAATRQWFDIHFPNIFEAIYFAGRHDSEQSKGQLCSELGAEWLIDDNVGHAETARDCDVKVVLFGDYGWHKDIEIHKDIVRCKDWRAVLEYFDGR